MDGQRYIAGHVFIVTASYSADLAISQEYANLICCKPTKVSLQMPGFTAYFYLNFLF